MSKFVPRWSRWSAAQECASGAQTANQQASKTSKSPFAGFAGSLKRHSRASTGQATRRESDCSKKLPGHDLKMEEIELMALVTFAGAGLVVQVHSRILDRGVLFVSNNVPEAALEGTDLPIYRAAELKNLAIMRPPPHALQVVHDVKTIFDGVITDVREDRSSPSVAELRGST